MIAVRQQVAMGVVAAVPETMEGDFVVHLQDSTQSLHETNPGLTCVTPSSPSSSTSSSTRSFPPRPTPPPPPPRHKVKYGWILAADVAGGLALLEQKGLYGEAVSSTLPASGYGAHGPSTRVHLIDIVYAKTACESQYTVQEGDLYTALVNAKTHTFVVVAIMASKALKESGEMIFVIGWVAEGDGLEITRYDKLTRQQFNAAIGPIVYTREPAIGSRLALGVLRAVQAAFCRHPDLVGLLKRAHGRTYDWSIGVKNVGSHSVTPDTHPVLLKDVIRLEEDPPKAAAPVKEPPASSQKRKGATSASGDGGRSKSLRKASTGGGKGGTQTSNRTGSRSERKQPNPPRDHPNAQAKKGLDQVAKQLLKDNQDVQALVQKAITNGVTATKMQKIVSDVVKPISSKLNRLEGQVNAALRSAQDSKAAGDVNAASAADVKKDITEIKQLLSSLATNIAENQKSTAALGKTTEEIGKSYTIMQAIMQDRQHREQPPQQSAYSTQRVDATPDSFTKFMAWQQAQQNAATHGAAPPGAFNTPTAPTASTAHRPGPFGPPGLK